MGQKNSRSKGKASMLKALGQKSNKRKTPLMDINRNNKENLESDFVVVHGGDVGGRSCSSGAQEIEIGLIGYDFGLASDEDLPIPRRSQRSSPDNLSDINKSIERSSQGNVSFIEERVSKHSTTVDETPPPPQCELYSTPAVTTSTAYGTTEKRTFTGESIINRGNDYNNNISGRKSRKSTNIYDSVNNNLVSSKDRFHSDNLDSPFTKQRFFAYAVNTKKTISYKSKIPSTSGTRNVTSSNVSHHTESPLSDDTSSETSSSPTASSVVDTQVPATTTTAKTPTVTFNLPNKSSNKVANNNILSRPYIQKKVAPRRTKLTMNSSRQTTKGKENPKHAKSSGKVTFEKQSNKGDDNKEIKERKGCCKPVAPPVFIESFNRYGGDGGNIGGGRKGCINPADRLKNVDVVEELLYYVPTPENCNEADFDYYCVNDCGEMELIECPPAQQNKCCYNPVKYSRRQRFNFRNSRDEDDEGPPFPWLNPTSKNCCCSCCRAGLRRNPNCCCPCCEEKGNARASNSFDELPVGKNPQIQPKNFDAPCSDEEEEEEESESEESSEESEHCEELLPNESGLYFYDAKLQRFVRQQPPETPPPIVIVPPAPPPPPPPPARAPPPAIRHINKPKKRKPQAQPIIQPMIMNPPPLCPPPPCCGNSNNCNCNCNNGNGNNNNNQPAAPAAPPNYIPIMMCGGYNAGNRRKTCCRKRPPPCRPPPYYGYQPQRMSMPMPANTNPTHSSHHDEQEESESEESEESASEDQGSEEYSEESQTQDISTSLEYTEEGTTTTITVPPGHKGDLSISAGPSTNTKSYSNS